ncbi:uncharacterized protein LOC129928135 [Biomphalaria glabrata]|uniref:Uncharacterized protein LOC129928135 n=1 Tax=Biomphalaria glabrata TaxID=6526 RepID=A0A9W3BBT0_BIOGL|nr:uncharacterized protein LOC129928135 [Biomphalaria glabrata]
MKTWITLGFIKKRVNKKFKYFYVLKKGKPIRKRSFFKNSHPAVIKDFLKRKPKNPVTQKISFLHGIHRVLNKATLYCITFILRELAEYCGPSNNIDIQRLRIAVISQAENLFTLNDSINSIHDNGCRKEDLDQRISSVAHCFNDADISSCSCRNSIYSHYNLKMEKCLAKDNVSFSSKYLDNSQSLRNKRSCFLSLQKCVKALSISNLKQYN